MIRLSTRWLLLLGVFLLIQPVIAQDDYQKKLEQSAFQMIKVTVEFLATDAQTFPKVQSTQCDCDSYDSLKAFITTNDLVGADKLVDEARRRAAQHIAQINQPKTALTEVKDFLIQKITSGNRANRKMLPGYTAYETKLGRIIDGGLSGETVAEVHSPTPTVAEPVTPADTVTDTQDVSNTPTTNSPSNWMSMAGIALSFSILSLLGVAFLAYLFMKNRQPQPSARDVQVDSQLAKLADRISKLEIRKNQPNENFQLNAKLDALERAVRQLEQNRAEKPASTTPMPKVPLEVVAPAQAEVPVQPTNRFRNAPAEPAKPKAFYARTADLGDGFSASGLLLKPERDTVFDILLQSDMQAIYRVSENPDAQRLALSDPYSYLNDACEYLTQPNPTSRIQTEQPGQLSLQGDKWKIVEKAKIRFIS
ncbi:hypothetical protein ACO2Q8_21160 [Larkinella sp. VNQ87]|uniref:hypothetical protein n=1 Tax=Larkinella sp. VNQ87 TaxID=3400921 RepID=UPI003C10D0CE